MRREIEPATPRTEVDAARLAKAMRVSLDIYGWDLDEMAGEIAAEYARLTEREGPVVPPDTRTTESPEPYRLPTTPTGMWLSNLAPELWKQAARGEPMEPMQIPIRRAILAIEAEAAQGAAPLDPTDGSSCSGPCPGGCGCTLYSPDADPKDCGCDSYCTMDTTDWPKWDADAAPDAPSHWCNCDEPAGWHTHGDTQPDAPAPLDMVTIPRAEYEALKRYDEGRAAEYAAELLEDPS